MGRASTEEVVASSSSRFVDLSASRETFEVLFAMAWTLRRCAAQGKREMSTFLHMSEVIVEGSESAFSVHLNNFDGPFDLLLQLISRHKMDITEVALSQVTDEFIAYIRALEGSAEGWDLDQTTEFLVVAATLLDIKAARLLPSGEIEDE